MKPSGRRVRRALTSLFQPLLQPLLSQEPAEVLIRQTARQQWRLVLLNLGSSLVEALTEGATLAVIFLAVQALSAQPDHPFDWGSNPVIRALPGAPQLLAGLPPAWAFLLLLGLALLLQALQCFSRYLNTVSVGYFAARCRALVTARIHQQVLRFSFPCASRYKVGDLNDYAGQGPDAVRQQIETSGNLLVSALLIATYVVVLVGISPWLLLAVVVMGGLITALQKQLLPRIRGGAREVTAIQVGISTRVTEDFQGLRLLHSSGQLDAADRNLQLRMGSLERAMRGQSRRMAVVAPVTTFLPILAMALIASLSLLLFGGRSSGVMPSLVTFVLSLQRLNMRIGTIAGTFNQLAENSGRLERLNQILSPADKQFRRLGGRPFRALERGIRFERVSLRYDPQLPLALEDLSLSLPKGRMLALVGPSGAGKSSIADLLVGLYAPTAGRILVDGVDLQDLDLSSWQQRLGVVSQDTFLFNASLAENIAFGVPDATQERIEAAAAAAQAAGFIEALPDGYRTLVGERGYRLSGGQRQRISLARAILRDPQLLILDEATSALDSQSERLVQEAIERFEHNHTVLVIAHRLSTIVRADEILVLDHGRVVERGDHQGLLRNGGLYQQLWVQQSQAAVSPVVRTPG